jgi:manganese/zinc/iron transport system substrate-binding protein
MIARPFKSFAAAVLAAAAAMGAAHAQTQPINVVTTVGMIADVARNVGGSCVAVTAIMGPGIDPHLYRARAGDVQTLQRAEIILYSGYFLEGQLGEVLARFAEMKPTLAVSPASVSPADLIAVEDLYGIDPHLWMDVSLWSQIAPTIADALIELRPGCADEITSNLKTYTGELAALHDWVTAAIATIPVPQRILVTAHDAFNYYGRAYGIDVAGIQGISTESEAGVADIRDMARIVSERQVPAVFIESTINPGTIQAVIDAARNLGHTVTIGGELYSDAMGAAGSAGGTYIGMIYQNTVNIVDALGGTVPALPPALAGWATPWGFPVGPTP